MSCVMSPLNEGNTKLPAFFVRPDICKRYPGSSRSSTYGTGRCAWIHSRATIPGMPNTKDMRLLASQLLAHRSHVTIWAAFVACGSCNCVPVILKRTQDHFCRQYMRPPGVLCPCLCSLLTCSDQQFNLGISVSLRKGL